MEGTSVLTSISTEFCLPMFSMRFITLYFSVAQESTEREEPTVFPTHEISRVVSKQPDFATSSPFEKKAYFVLLCVVLLNMNHNHNDIFTITCSSC